MGGETRTIASMFGASTTTRISSDPASKRPRKRESDVEKSSFVDCPMCAKPFHPKLIQAHAETCLGAKEVIPKPSAVPLETDKSLPAVKTEAPPEAPPILSSEKKKENTSSTGAFASLMQAQRETKCELVFSVWIENSIWRWKVERGKESTCDQFKTKPWRSVTTFKEKTKDDKPCSTSVHLVTNVPSCVEGKSASYENSHLLSPSVLKSAIQKAIRRGKCGAAARCTHELLNINPPEALRRLLVISVEDATLHPSTPLITWFMLAQAKGYCLGPEAKAAVVRFAAELAACDVKDTLEEVMDDENNSTNPESPTFSNAFRNLGAACADLTEEHGALVISLAIRGHFGGMRCDVDMLRTAASTWRSRFLVDKKLWTEGLDMCFQDAMARAAADAGGMPPPLSYAEPLKVGPVTRGDVPLAAVDFHVSPVIDRLMEMDSVRAAAARALKCAPSLAGDDGSIANPLRSAMWAHCSSVSTKKRLLRFADLTEKEKSLDRESVCAAENSNDDETKALATLWEEIQGATSSFQKRFIASRVPQMYG